MFAGAAEEVGGGEAEFGDVFGNEIDRPAGGEAAAKGDEATLVDDAFEGGGAVERETEVSA